MKRKQAKNTPHQTSRHFKTFSAIPLAAAIMSAIFLLASCSGGTPAVTGSTESAGGTVETLSSGAYDIGTIDTTFKSDDLSATGDGTASAIVFDDSSISFDSSKAGISGNDLVITAAGTYTLSGSKQNTRIVIKAGKSDTVRLVLNGLTITSSDSAAIYVISADKVIITLADGTVNTVTDASDYTFGNPEETEPDAAIFSKADLTINGSGTLNVNGRYKHGIVSKDDLVITGGIIHITAVSDGIRGRDSITSTNAEITVDAGSDGIQSSNDEDLAKGYIYIDGGTYTITAGNDGIQAQNAVWIKSGNVSVTTGGGSGQSLLTSQESYKGLKATYEVIVDSGNIDISSKDDAIHSNDTIRINGGTITISSGDDGMHADNILAISGGDVDIRKSYEGIESANIEITGGKTQIIASDDGLNTAGGADGSAQGGRPGQGGFDSSDGSTFTMSGGYVAINCYGDGIDVNGDGVMTGGTIVTSGPTNDGNGPMDYNGSFKVTGGFIVAAGSSGMAQVPDTTSTQNSVLVYLTSQQAGGTIVSIQDSEGNSLLAYAPEKAYSSVAFTSPELATGKTYTVYVGGTATGTVTNGLYTDGGCSGGSKIAAFTVSSVVTTSGSGGKQGAPGRR